MNTIFQINSRSNPVVGFVDTGNTFFNCISEKTCLALGVLLNQLKPSPTPVVRQAGGGATLQVLGRLPDDVPSEGFSLTGLKKLFPFKDVFVIRGLNHDFNISATFLQKYKFQIDLETQSLNFKGNSQVTHIPFISKFKSGIAIQKISPLVPKRGILVQPRQEITVESSGTMEGSIFSTREPDFSPKEVKGLLRENEPNPEPWEVHEHPTKPSWFTVRNRSETARTVYDNFRLGSLCKIVLPDKSEIDIAVQASEKKKAYIKSKVNVEQQFEKLFLDNLHELLLGFAEAISFNGEPGLTTLGKTYIVTPRDTKPVYCPQNRISPDVYEIIRTQIEKWLSEKVIIPVDGPGSDWNARLIIVPKKQVKGEPRSYRVCLDLRHVNKLCMIDYSPFAPFSMQETFHMLGGAKIFSSIDLTQAFNSIPIYEKHRHKTAFCINGQTYYFAKTPFGLSSAPAALGKVLSQAFKDIPRSFCVYYMDDIIVYSEDAKTHLRHLKIVLQALLNAGLKISLPKCKFFRTSLEFLGHLITTEGYQLIKSYLEPILNWPMVKSKYDVQSFLGSTNYYNEFIYNYSKKAKPLFLVLTKPGGDEEPQNFTPFEIKDIWAAMTQLKKDLTRSPTLAFADFSKGSSNFILDTDYSAKHHTIGAVLSQIQPPGSGRERVILYKAKALRPTQKSYSPYKGEIFAVCYFILKLKFFLQLRHFVLRVDCNSLKWLQTQEQIPTGIVLRWLQTLAENSFSVVHRKRSEHTNADSLSRCPNPEMVTSSDDEAALAKISTIAPSKTDQKDSLECPFCQSIEESETALDFHVDTSHFSLDTLSFQDWMTVQKLKGNNLQAAFTSDSTALSMASTPIKLESYSATQRKNEPTAQIGDDGAVTYSNAQWRAFQRLDPPLRLAMDSLEKVPLTEPISKAAHPLLMDGEIVDGVLKYKFFADGEKTPRYLTVVPFALQIPTLLYFHYKHGCSDQIKTIEMARKFIYFKNMALAFKAMRERCRACCLRNKPMPKNKFQLISHRYVEPWFAIAIDHVGPIDPPQKGNRYLFTVKDLFSGWCEFFPCPSTEAVYVCEILALEIVARYGTPNIIVSDQHKSFTSKIFNKFCSDLGITLKHSSARNPTGNWVERAHQDFKRKTNSLLRQKEEYSMSQFSCDICEMEFSSEFRLRRHLDTHEQSELTEAIISPAREASRLIDQELAKRDHKNWVATLPSVLWAMRTEHSATRGASPYEILFAKNPTTSLDLLYGQPVKLSHFSTSADYLRARHRKHEVCEAYVKQNLAKQLLRQRQYYVGLTRSFEKGDWVYLFTPVKTDGVSEKIDTFWSGPWRVKERLASTTYRIEPIPGKFVGSFQPLTVQVDRIKTYHQNSPVVTPPPTFTGRVSNANLNVEQNVIDPVPMPTHYKKALARADPPEDEGGILDAKPPWQSHLPDNVTMPNKEGVWPEPKKPAKIPLKDYKAIKEKRRQQAAKFTGLPAPPLTRARAKQAGHAINAITNSNESHFESVEEQLAQDYVMDHPIDLPKYWREIVEDTNWDHFMYHRYYLK